jgi:hypothetical protein
MKYLNYLIILIFQSFKIILPIHCLDNNSLNKNLNAIIPILQKDNLLSKKILIFNKGTDDTYTLDPIIEQNKLKIIEQNFLKKKILDILIDNSTCNISKLELIEKYSFLFVKDNGLKKDFDEFLTS